MYNIHVVVVSVHISTVDLYCHATSQVLEVPQTQYFSIQLGCIFMRVLEYKGFVLAVFPLKYGSLYTSVRYLMRLLARMRILLPSDPYV